LPYRKCRLPDHPIREAFRLYSYVATYAVVFLRDGENNPEDQMQAIKVNGKMREVKSSEDTPLFYVLKDELSVSSPQFGCGLAQC
jgi:hypothetical protein